MMLHRKPEIFYSKFNIIEVGLYTYIYASVCECLCEYMLFRADRSDYRRKWLTLNASIEMAEQKF